MAAPQVRTAGARGRPRFALGRPTPLLRLQLQRQLGQLGVFAGCDRRQLGRLARWGDLVQVEPGEVILREDHSDWWFVVVLSGSLALTRGGRPVGTVGAGEHVGADTIVGLRPQRATARTAEPTVLFLLGPRYLLSLVTAAPTFQRTLFPDVGPADYPEFSHRMLEQGRAEWHRVGLPPGWSRRGPAAEKRRPAGVWPVTSPRPGRILTLRDAVAVITCATAGQESPAAPGRAPVRRLSPWWRRGAAAGAGALTLVALIAYHPPVAVVTAGRPLDVVSDIAISGVPTHPADGHYLLLWISVSRPDLAGTVAAFLTGRTTVSAGPALSASQEAAAERIGRRQYLASRGTAVAAAIRLAGLDPRRVRVRIRDRGLTGPSAGLVYALAVSDLLGRDLAHGRAVAATGTLDPAGQVGAVGWVVIKATGAAGAGASVLLVPQGEAGGVLGSGYRGPVLVVSSLAQAEAALTATRP
ncbi:MAG TPA: cyclic nucleotide-binding domain-containing protein [Acidimicrobiales bacterium]|nr:cyclic nucleotide-binding domain-containing protein [Acidimicrobiales bacterium]